MLAESSRGGPPSTLSSRASAASRSPVLVSAEGLVLQIEHKALRKWLLPGGHAEDSDASLLDAAQRELAEETGISPEQVEPASGVPLDIDVHMIPANDAKGEPGHPHFDFRFLFRSTADAVVLQEEEVTDYGWTSPDKLTAEPLRSRVLAAVRPYADSASVGAGVSSSTCSPVTR
jgi:8-oxo-dGTP pyrophosphatase MutT (NUDIX family)